MIGEEGKRLCCRESERKARMISEKSLLKAYEKDTESYGDLMEQNFHYYKKLDR
jgi:hypothetical protein